LFSQRLNFAAIIKEPLNGLLAPVNSTPLHPQKTFKAAGINQTPAALN
jgi:hypothetical protein